MKVLGLLLGAGTLALAAGQADATIYLGLQVGNGAITTIADDGGTGNLTYAASYGGFTNSIIVQGFPTLDQPAIQTASINTKKGDGSAAAMLTVYITQTDLNPISGSLLSSFTSNTFQGSALSVAESTFLSTTNQLFTGDFSLAAQTFTGLGSKDYSTTVPTLTNPFSETTKYVINAGTGSSSFNDSINITSGAVPEPASWAMMLVGFGVIGAALRQRRPARVSFG